MTSKATKYVVMAVVHRPNDMGIDLPAGAKAADLKPTDYRIIEMPDGGEGERADVPRPRDPRLRSFRR